MYEPLERPPFVVATAGQTTRATEYNRSVQPSDSPFLSGGYVVLTDVLTWVDGVQRSPSRVDGRDSVKGR